MDGQRKDQNSTTASPDTPADGASSEQPKAGDESTSGKSQADGMSGSGPRRGSLSNPSNPYDETKASERQLAGEPDSKGG